MLGVLYAHKKKDTHTLAVYVLLVDAVVFSQKHERTTTVVLFRAPFIITALSRGEREREREGEREAFRVVVFYTFVRSRGVKVCVFYRDPSFGPEKKTKKKSLPNNERPKMHRHHQQPVVARLSLLPLSREESPTIKE